MEAQLWGLSWSASLNRFCGSLDNSRSGSSNAELTNPVRAVKSNLNSVIALALAVGICAALGSAMYWLVRSGYAALVYVEFILGSICLYGLYKLLVQNYAVSRWQRIDD